MTGPRKPDHVSQEDWDDMDIPEWSEQDFRNARPTAEAVPELADAYRRSRGRPAGSNKQLISLRLDKDVIEHFRATGPGWQARINDTLKASFRSP